MSKDLLPFHTSHKLINQTKTRNDIVVFLFCFDIFFPEFDQMSISYNPVTLNVCVITRHFLKSIVVSHAYA